MMFVPRNGLAPPHPLLLRRASRAAGSWLGRIFWAGAKSRAHPKQTRININDGWPELYGLQLGLIGRKLSVTVSREICAHF